eukprot:COSAG02_NODE_43133_length_377_cov_2.025180_2_plen_54_part_01
MMPFSSSLSLSPIIDHDLPAPVWPYAKMVPLYPWKMSCTDCAAQWLYTSVYATI